MHAFKSVFSHQSIEMESFTWLVSFDLGKQCTEYAYECERNSWIPPTCRHTIITWKCYHTSWIFFVNSHFTFSTDVNYMWLFYYRKNICSFLVVHRKSLPFRSTHVQRSKLNSLLFPSFLTCYLSSFCFYIFPPQRNSYVHAIFA